MENQNTSPFEVAASVAVKINKAFRRRGTITTAADQAAHRRSMITGKLRKLSENKMSLHGQQRYSKDDLGFLFGGSAKPKLATEKVNVRKEKEKAMAWIKEESIKYD
jgi:hypothetical protein